MSYCHSSGPSITQMSKMNVVIYRTDKGHDWRANLSLKGIIVSLTLLAVDGSQTAIPPACVLLRITIPDKTIISFPKWGIFPPPSVLGEQKAREIISVLEYRLGVSGCLMMQKERFHNARVQGDNLAEIFSRMKSNIKVELINEMCFLFFFLYYLVDKKPISFCIKCSLRYSRDWKIHPPMNYE